jgi:hypothetical protein
VARSPRAPAPAEAYLLTDLVGAEVRDGDRRIGRLRDVAIRADADGWPVVAVRVRTRAGELDLPWSAVRVHAAGQLDVDASAAADAGAAAWLAADVLDHELIDVDGKRVVRVGDVVLESRDGLTARGIEIGAAPILRRLGLRRAAGRRRRDLVPVSAVHLPRAAAGPLALATTRARLETVETHALVELFQRLPRPAANDLLEELPPGRAEHVRHHLRHRRRTGRWRRHVPRFRAP